MSSQEQQQISYGKLQIVNVALHALQQSPMQSIDSPTGSLEEGLLSMFGVSADFALRDIRPKSATVETVLTRLDVTFDGRMPYRYALPTGYVQLANALDADAYDIGVLSYQGEDRPVLKASEPGPLTFIYISNKNLHLLDAMTVNAIGLHLAYTVGRQYVSSAERARIFDEYGALKDRARGSGALEEHAAQPTISSPSLDAFWRGGGEISVEN